MRKAMAVMSRYNGTVITHVTQLACLLITCFHITFASAPVGCALSDTVSLIGRYDCDFNAISIPLTMTDFSSPDPQRLRIYNISGTLPSPSFSGFSSFNTGTIDKNYPASLEIECENGGTLTISAGTFAGMGYLQEFIISDCVISDLPDNVFSDFGTLNYFKIKGGSIGSTQINSLNGLSITRSSTPSPKGEFAIVNSPITGGSLATGFLYPLTTVSVLILENIGIYTIDVNTFSQNTIVTNLSIAGNNIQTIPKNLFLGLDTLLFLDMGTNPFNCSCSELWFLDYLNDNDINMVGAAICNEPSSYNSKRATKYHDENCPYDPCGSMPGINADPLCYTIFQLFGYVVICSCFVISWAAIFLYLNTRIHIALPKYRLEQKKKKAWIKVKDSLYKGVVNLIPPASTGIKHGQLPQMSNAFRKRLRFSNEVQPFDLPNYSDLVKEDLTKYSTECVENRNGEKESATSVQVHIPGPSPSNKLSIGSQKKTNGNDGVLERVTNDRQGSSVIQTEKIHHGNVDGNKDNSVEPKDEIQSVNKTCESKAPKNVVAKDFSESLILNSQIDDDAKGKVGDENT